MNGLHVFFHGGWSEKIDFEGKTDLIFEHEFKCNQDLQEIE